MKLNYKIAGQGQSIILIHGLFGSLDNLGILARDLEKTHQVISVDLRNHGLSPWSDEMSHTLMANDIISIINDLCLDNITIIGHSLGGRVAMKLASFIPEKMKQLFILDIAPVTYPNTPPPYLAALEKAIKSESTDRKEITAIMTPFLREQVIQFLLKSFKNQHWLFNFKAIEANYAAMCQWKTLAALQIPALFMRGELSHYLLEEHYPDIQQQFPLANFATVAGAGHNIHAEKPEVVLKLIRESLLV